MICGIVLSGGRSSRFGREKAGADFGGQPLIDRPVATLARGCEIVAVNARPDSEAAAFALSRGLALVPDAAGDPDGPLAGIKAGMSWARALGAEFLATAPCDTPFLPEDMVRRLLGALTPITGISSGAGAAVAVTADGVQPLCAVWRTDRLALVKRALEGGRHPPIRGLLAEVGRIEVAFGDTAAFANLNTPDSFATALGDLAEGAPRSAPPPSEAG